MPKDDKDFYNVADMTNVFRRTCESLDDPTNNASEATKMYAMARWQIRAQLATAQQLCVMAGHLSDIAGRLREADEKVQE